MREPLSRDYWRFWGASGLSNFGDGLRLVALPLLAVTLTRDPLLIAGISALAFLPWVVVGPFSGAVVDRVDRRRLIIVVQLMRGIAVAGFAAVVAADEVTIGLVYAIAVLVGLGETLADSAAQAAIPRLATSGQLERANSRLIAVEIVTNEVVGGPVGGALFALMAALPFGIDAGTYLVAAAMVARVRTDLGPGVAEGTRTTIRADVVEGMRWLWSHRLLRPVAVGIALVNLGFSAFMAIFVLYAVEILGLPDVGFGILLGVGAAGGLVGTAIAEPLVGRFGRAATTVTPIGVTAVGALVLGLAPNVFVAGAALLLVTAAVSVTNIVGRSIRQVVTPTRLLGRVVAGFRLIGFSMGPLGAVLGGLVADALGLRAPFLFAVIVIIVATFVMKRALTDEAIAAAISENPDIH